MMREKAKAEATETEEPKVKSAILDDNKIKFEVWFSMNLGKIPGMEAHHFAAIKAFFGSVGIKDLETPENFEQGIFKFGYKPAV